MLPTFFGRDPGADIADLMAAFIGLGAAGPTGHHPTRSPAWSPFLSSDDAGFVTGMTIPIDRRTRPRDDRHTPPHNDIQPIRRCPRRAALLPLRPRRRRGRPRRTSGPWPRPTSRSAPRRGESAERIEAFLDVYRAHNALTIPVCKHVITNILAQPEASTHTSTHAYFEPSCLTDAETKVIIGYYDDVHVVNGDEHLLAHKKIVAERVLMLPGSAGNYTYVGHGRLPRFDALLGASLSGTR